MNKIGLKIRAAVITTVYNKSLAVSLTTLSKFSAGEVCDCCVKLSVVLSIFLLQFLLFKKVMGETMLVCITCVATCQVMIKYSDIKPYMHPFVHMNMLSLNANPLNTHTPPSKSGPAK